MSFKGQNLGEAPAQRPETQPRSWEGEGSDRGWVRLEDPTWVHLGKQHCKTCQHPTSCSQLQPHTLSITYRHYSKQLSEGT